MVLATRPTSISGSRYIMCRDPQHRACRRARAVEPSSLILVHFRGGRRQGRWAVVNLELAPRALAPAGLARARELVSLYRVCGWVPRCGGAIVHPSWLELDGVPPGVAHVVAHDLIDLVDDGVSILHMTSASA